MTGALHGTDKEKAKNSSGKEPLHLKSAIQNVPSDAAVKKLQQVFNWYRQFGGADGSNEGMNGSVNANSLFDIFQVLNIIGETVVDFGMGEGRVAASAIAYGALSAFGYDLPANFTYCINFSAVMDKMAHKWTEIQNIRDRVAWYGINIDTVVACWLYELRAINLFFCLFGSLHLSGSALHELSRFGLACL
jgi:hypothetical protein